MGVVRMFFCGRVDKLIVIQFSYLSVHVQYYIKCVGFSLG